MSDSTIAPTTREYSYADRVRQEWGEEWHKRDYVYHFSNDRKFYEPIVQIRTNQVGGVNG